MNRHRLKVGCGEGSKVFFFQTRPIFLSQQPVQKVISDSAAVGATT